MPLSKRKFAVRRHPVIVDIGCGCRRNKLSSFFSSINPIPKKQNPYFSTTSLTTTTTTTTTSSSSFSFQDSPQNPTCSNSMNQNTKKKKKKKMMKKKTRVVGESVAVEKDSSEPYLDFRESMVQMIVENQIYGWDDLRELLHSLLSLNSPQYHPLILRAFSDVCHAIFSPPSD
ncbi:transcription repressor OFP8-like [Dioscorea cayenensis subsp. rotundata]|uniref:Transcription repressor n=1 Tax=Dioscorea cayennensis subsp. rotundata TaxID=55577 RepID=A0AB40ATC4_DIOCR|nr:transcription repressor OFP8-like [Dioscorea cayenensis subsp. rotundata]